MTMYESRVTYLLYCVHFDCSLECIILAISILSLIFKKFNDENKWGVCAPK